MFLMVNVATAVSLGWWFRKDTLRILSEASLVVKPDHVRRVL